MKTKIMMMWSKVISITMDEPESTKVVRYLPNAWRNQDERLVCIERLMYTNHPLNKI
jgi:hypothetical protein